VSVRRLRLGDEPILEMLAKQDASYDLEGRGVPRTPLGIEDARAYLSDDHILHWIAEDDGVVVGHLLCHVQRKRAEAAFQLMLYEIGVLESHRRRGIGSALIAAMDSCMAERRISTAWVLADNSGAEDFYRALGFQRDSVQPVQLSRITGAPRR
jgi:ribosomal protein S18 acetylase RimI-like enzyme